MQIVLIVTTISLLLILFMPIIFSVKVNVNFPSKNVVVDLFLLKLIRIFSLSATLKQSYVLIEGSKNAQLPYVDIDLTPPKNMDLIKAICLIKIKTDLNINFMSLNDKFALKAIGFVSVILSSVVLKGVGKRAESNVSLGSDTTNMKIYATLGVTVFRVISILLRRSKNGSTKLNTANS